MIKSRHKKREKETGKTKGSRKSPKNEEDVGDWAITSGNREFF